MKKLNLGCGNDYREGWLNVDLDKNYRADLYLDLRERLPFGNNEIDYILAQDILEHFTKEEGREFLKECFRVLKDAGGIKIQTSEVFQIIKKFGNDPETALKFIYGDTSGNSDLGSHKFGYTAKSLTKLLRSLGFGGISTEKDNTNFILTAKKKSAEIYPIKVLISGQDSGGLGGAEKFLLSLAGQLRKAKVEIEFTTYAKSLFNKQVKKDNFLTWEIPVRMDIISNFKGLLKFIFFLPFIGLKDYLILQGFKKSGGDLILITGFSDKIVLSPIAKLLSIPVIWLEYSPLAEVMQKNLYLPKLFYRLVKEIPSLVIVPSRNTKKHLIPETRISDAKIEIIPCGIELLKRAKISQEKGVRIIGMVSRIETEKGQDTLIKAAAILKKRVKKFKVVIVGAGDTKKLKKLVEKYGLGNTVHFLGYRQDVYKIMSSFDIFVFPSRWKLEGFGLVLVEAMMLGLPIIASDFGPIPEVVGKAGILIKPGEKHLAQAIESLLKDAKKRAGLSLEGVKRARLFDIKNISRKYLQIFTEQKRRRVLP